MTRHARRGFTIAEVVAVLFIVGIMLAAIAFAMPLFLRAPLEAQSQVDGVQSAALALYRMQRDVRQSDPNGIFACSLGPPVSCMQPPPGTAPSPTQSIAVVSANNGQFVVAGAGQVDPGSPKWQGFVVYWLAPNADGSSQELRRAFVLAAINVNADGTPSVGAGDAALAVAAATTAGTYVTVAQDVRSVALAVDTTQRIADLKIDAGDRSGNLSSLKLAGNSYVRN